MSEIYNFKVLDITGNEVSLDQYKGKTLLIVNVASKCGFTPQYSGLQNLYEKYQAKDFAVLGFPCNQFGSQEPGNDSEIQSFCDMNYSVNFPMFSKVDVNGTNASPFFEYLKDKAPGLLGSKAIKWNFTKFLIDSNGKVIKRYAPKDKPEAIAQEIEKYISP